MDTTIWIIIGVVALVLIIWLLTSTKKEKQGGTQMPSDLPKSEESEETPEQ